MTTDQNKSLARGVSLALSAALVMILGVITMPGAPSSSVAYAAAPSPDDYTDPQEMYHPTTYVVIGIVKIDHWIVASTIADDDLGDVSGTRYGSRSAKLNHIVWLGQNSSVTIRVYTAQTVGETGLEWLETGFYPNSQGAATTTRKERPTSVILLEVPQSVALSMGAATFDTCDVLKGNTADFWKTVVFPEFCMVAGPATP